MTFTDFNKVAESKNQVVRFIHVATGTTVQFAAFITEFVDDYSVQWGSEQIFGRNDPIKPYQATTRQLQVGFDVLSHDLKSSKENLNKYSTLTKMLYPVYSAPLNGAGNSLGRTIKAPPLIRVKFVNMVQAADGNGSLLGCIEGFNYTPNRDVGFFVERDGSLFPKHFNLSFRFTPQHESPLGWDAQTGGFITDNFPYSATTTTVGSQSQGQDASKEQAKQDKLFGG